VSGTSDAAILQELSAALSGISALQAAATKNAAAVSALQITIISLGSLVRATQTSIGTIEANILELISMSETVQTELNTETTDVAALVTAVNSAVGVMSTLGAQLQQAIANAGLSSDQAAAFDALHTSIEQATGSLNSAVTAQANTPPPAPAPAATPKP
jgi:hypothetical protein